MKNKNLIISGLVINAIYIFINRYEILPDFFLGFLLGIGASLMIVGMYLEKKAKK